MSPRTPTCPSCSSDLTLHRVGELDTWKCRLEHGEAMTLNEAHGHLQDDEIQQLWKKARGAAYGAGPRHCPMCTESMVAIEVTYDDDEISETEPGDGADDGSVWLDVCEPCQLIWFDTHELSMLPLDRPNAEPTAAELAGVAEITQQFGNDYTTAIAERSSHDLAERIARKFKLIKN